MEIALIKSPTGSLVPLGEAEAESLKRFKSGTVINCKISEMRNGRFFRKWWTLANMAFEMSSERMTPMEHNGVPVLPSFERFRKDLTILAGYFDPVYGYDGSVRLEARSLQWSKMEEEEFTKLYSATIDAVLQKILPHVKKSDLENAIAMTMAYA